MQEMVHRIDDIGKPAWIALMVLGFIVFWPAGLAILAFLLWSGRMGCGTRRDWHGFKGSWDEQRQRWDREARARAPTGNRAFDDYREETLKRLEEEAIEFRDFLDRLRMAKDRSEFDQFMSERKARPAGTGGDQPNPA